MPEERYPLGCTVKIGHIAGPTQRCTEDMNRARIAIAAYRLLDPRERSDTYERVQLCFPIDREDSENDSTPAGKLVDQMPRVLRRKSTGVRLMGQPLIDEAIEGNAQNDEDPDGADVATIEMRASSDLSLEERRGIVRLMRQSDESTLRGLSPLGWLRSRLGI
jgi:hypothetical protein